MPAQTQMSCFVPPQRLGTERPGEILFKYTRRPINGVAALLSGEPRVADSLETRSALGVVAALV